MGDAPNEPAIKVHAEAVFERHHGESREPGSR